MGTILARLVHVVTPGLCELWQVLGTLSTPPHTSEIQNHVQQFCSGSIKFTGTRAHTVSTPRGSFGRLGEACGLLSQNTVFKCFEKKIIKTIKKIHDTEIQL